MDEKTTYQELIAKYLAQEITASEQSLLSGWLKAHPDNQQTFDQLQKAWDKVGEQTPDFEPNVDAAWNKLKHRIGQGQTVNVEKKEANVISLFPSSFLRIAASVVLVAGLSSLGFFYLKGLNQTEVQISALNERTRFTLPDSSQVWLNPNTQLSYIEGFDGDVREVKLNGDAFFDIKRNEAKPFVVLGQKTRVQVLGTSFLVHSKGGDEREFVEVATGKVQFTDKNDSKNTCVLTAGDEAFFTPSRPLEVKKEVTQNASAWKTKRLAFDNTSLKDVLADVERYFGISVKVENEAMLNCRFTGVFENPTIEGVLQIVSISVNSTYQKDANQYLLLGIGCSSVNN